MTVRPSMDDICAKLNEIEGYKEQFNAIFGEDATAGITLAKGRRFRSCARSWLPIRPG